jgi:hypothetical protein
VYVPYNRYHDLILTPRRICCPGKRQKLIHRSWSGHASSRVVTSPRVLPSPLSLNTPENSHYRRVHRIKVDEQVGITLATTELGGLVVRDIETDEVLWELPIVRFLSSFLTVCWLRHF